MGEHLLCKEGVRSSSLLGSTNTPLAGMDKAAVHCRAIGKDSTADEYATPYEEPEPRN